MQSNNGMYFKKLINFAVESGILFNTLIIYNCENEQKKLKYFSLDGAENCIFVSFEIRSKLAKVQQLYICVFWHSTTI